MRSSTVACSPNYPAWPLKSARLLMLHEAVGSMRVAGACTLLPRLPVLREAVGGVLSDAGAAPCSLCGWAPTPQSVR